MNIIGIDVSSYQGAIDWKKAKASGIDFAVLKIIRKDLNPDNQFENNWKGCEDAGVEIKGVYNYSYATTAEKARTDAKRVLEVLNGRKAMVWLDVEDNCQKKLGKALIEIINAYAEIITATGLEFGVYTGQSFYNSFIKPCGGLSYPLWLARYGSNDGTMQEAYRPDVEGMVSWQYTSNGSVSGINGRVDMDIWLKESEEEALGKKYIAHASIDENGKTTGGAAGDQTGKEVCIRTWYDNGWGYVLSIENKEVRKQFGNNMIDLANNDNVGYDQNQRNTLLTAAKNVNFDFSMIPVKCECDCSSAVTICILGAIYAVLGEAAYQKAYSVLVASGNCATTKTLRSRLANLDILKVSVYSSKTYTSKTTYAEYGDIYLKEGSHVVAYVSDGKKMEVDSKTENTTEEKSTDVFKWQISAIADGFSFPKYGADGEWGSECEAVAKKAIIKKHLIGYKYRTLTKIVQQAVGVTADGKCGKNTKAAIIAYQKEHGLTADGCVGLNTWKTILGV